MVESPSLASQTASQTAVFVLILAWEKQSLTTAVKWLANGSYLSNVIHVTVPRCVIKLVRFEISQPNQPTDQSNSTDCCGVAIGHVARLCFSQPNDKRKPTVWLERLPRCWLPLTLIFELLNGTAKFILTLGLCGIAISEVRIGHSFKCSHC